MRNKGAHKGKKQLKDTLPQNQTLKPAGISWPSTGRCLDSSDSCSKLFPIYWLYKPALTVRIITLTLQMGLTGETWRLEIKSSISFERTNFDSLNIQLTWVLVEITNIWLPIYFPYWVIIITNCEPICLFPSTRLGGKGLESQHWVVEKGMDNWQQIMLILVLALLLTSSLAWEKLSDCPPTQNAVVSSVKWKHNSHPTGLFWGLSGISAPSRGLGIPNPSQLLHWWGGWF